MLPRTHPDRIQIAFEDHRLVANAGLLLTATLAHHLGLSQLGRFAANGAWLAIQSLPRTRYGVMAHNLARPTARIALGEQVATTNTLRRRFFPLTGRIIRSARRLTLHLPQSWPWQEKFGRALARLRAIPLPA